MTRPVKNGQYVVPPEILALKPSGISCMVKAMRTATKASGVRIHYYVYELVRGVTAGAKAETGKISSGACIGKIESGAFCPNAKGVRLLKGLSENKTENSVKDSTDNSRSGVIPDLRDLDLQVKDYGAYAAVLVNAHPVFKQLSRYFSKDDSILIYALSIICFIQERMPVSCIQDVFDQSVLSSKWPNLDLSEDSVNKFLKLIGQHPAVCERYSQELIENSSGVTAIIWRVMLSGSKRNELADYGSESFITGSKQISALEAYDVIEEMPLTCKVYEGGLLDRPPVQDLLESYSFPDNTTFLPDEVFYSEESMKLYRQRGKHFIIPVPDNCAIKIAAQEFKSCDNSFVYVYERSDELERRDNGEVRQDRIFCGESSVRELEDLYQAHFDKEAEKKSAKAEVNYPADAKTIKFHTQKVTRSEFGDDRIIKFRDEKIHDEMVQDLKEQIGQDDEHTEEVLERIGPAFGVTVLRSNFDKMITPLDAYSDYEKYLSIKNRYELAENRIRFYGLRTDDYCVMQGLGFIFLVAGQIKFYFRKRQKESSSDYIRNLTLEECLIKAAGIKVSQHAGNKWHIAAFPRKTLELLKEMGVNIVDDLTRLNLFKY